MAPATTKKSSPNGKGKGKATAQPPAPAPAPSSPSSSSSATTSEDNDLLDLAESITAQAHYLAPGLGSSDLLHRANQVVKASFDRALASETLSFPHLQSLLSSLVPESGPSTRSSSSSSSAAPPARSASPQVSLEKTPLEELTTEGMDPEMIWEQMEMRNQGVVDLLDEMFGGGAEEEDGSGASEGEIDEDEEDGEEESEADEEEWERMMAQRGGEGSSDDDEDEEDDEEGEEMPFEESEPTYTKLGGSPAKPSPASGITMDDDDDGDDDDEPEDPQADPTKDLSISSFDGPSSASSSSRSRRAPGPPSAVDDTFFSLHDFHVQVDEGEFEMAKALRGDLDDEEDELAGDGTDELDLFAPVDLGGEDDDDGEELDQAGIMYKDFFEPPPRPIATNKKDLKGKKGKGKGPNKNAELSAEQPTPSSAPAPANPSVAESQDQMATKAGGKRSVRFNDAVKVKLIAPRGSEFDKLVAKVGWEEADAIYREREAGLPAGPEEGESEEEVEEDDGMPLDDAEGEDEENEDLEMENAEDEEDGEEEEEGSEEGEFESDDDEGQETIERLKSSLFDEEEDEEAGAPAQQLSRHERRLLSLSSQIAALEAENVGTKNWATKGEAKAKDRPQNSLLDEDLEYERTGKVVPVVTEESTKTIEDLIKRRILDNQFDDVIRQRAIDPNAFLPSRFMELQDSKSSKSLAEIYEEDYQTAQAKEEGRTVVHELDKELEEKHTEIEDLFEELSGKLDALSNARFTPKPPKAIISTITNLPTIAMESALPTATSAGTMLAPEEVYVPDPTAEDRSDFTPSQKKQARQKRRKARAAMAKTAEKFAAKKGGVVRAEKEKATKELLANRGVSVIGKGGKVTEGGKGVKRKRGEEGVTSGVALKL